MKKKILYPNFTEEEFKTKFNKIVEEYVKIFGNDFMNILIEHEKNKRHEK